MASVILGLSLNFYTRTNVNFTRVNKIEAMYGRSRVRVKVERGLTFTFTSGLSYIAYFIYERKSYVRSHGKITRQCKSTLTQASQKKHAVEHETREHSARDRRKEK